MINFPILCVDDFYYNPDEVREFALSLDFESGGGNYPGERTKPLHDVNEDFFNSFCARLFALYFNYRSEKISWIVESRFQKIYPYSKERNSPLNEGWVHLDDQSIAAGVIYLTPDAYPEAGTSFYQVTNPLADNQCDFTLRNDFYAGKLVDKEEYLREKDKHNKVCRKTLDIANIYNRMTFYGQQYPHRESNFYAHDDEPRLTQVFFVREMETQGTPIVRMNENGIIVPVDVDPDQEVWYVKDGVE